MKKKPTATSPYKTRKEIAAHLGFSTRTIFTLTESGALPYFKIGGAVRYRVEEVDAALNAKFHVDAAKK